MDARRRLVTDNTDLLRQGTALLGRIDETLFHGDPVGRNRDSVGRQFRHVTEFYHCFLEGLGESRIDYTARRRETRIEGDRPTSAACLTSIVEHLEDLGPSLPEELLVRAERVVDDGAEPIWGRSSASRELQFLVCHTVHHYALIKWLLRVQGFDTSPEFGVAPSTLRHWKEASVSPP